MILYFADRQMNIIGHASTTLPGGRVIREDLKSEEVETGVATFSCFIGFTDKTRAEVEAMASAGNYLLRSQDSENEFYTIIDSEIDTKNREVYIYAEDAGLDLINEIVGEYEATEAHNAEWYVNKYITDSGFEIGINEIPADRSLKLSWEGESTVTERLASIATQFGGFEVSYSYEIKGLEITKKYINIFEQRGKDEGVQLRLDRDIDRIVTSKSVANLATAFLCEGGVPDNAETPITFTSEKYSYDDGDFFIDGDKLKSRKANEKWSRYVWNKEPNKVGEDGGYIVRPYSYNTTNPETLKSHAMAELKKVCDMEINYEIDINRLPDGVKIGDRVNIVDDAGELYVSTRVLLLETSICDRKYKATLGEHIIKKSGIAQKVADLASEFAKNSQSAARAYEVAKNAAQKANEAKDAADQAANDAYSADQMANAASSKADEAVNAALAASNDALLAAGKVDDIFETVTEMDETVKAAGAAAEEAKGASKEAKGLAQEAKGKAEEAHAYYEEVKTEYPKVKEAAEQATAAAEEATGAASEATDFAERAKNVADAAKLDAEQAKKDIAEFGNELETTVDTLKAEYARKTDLTETAASLSSEIRRSAALISSVVSGRTVIDETANDAEELIDKAWERVTKASELASEAVTKAEQAQADYEDLKDDAEAAQEAADKANEAVTKAQELLDTARDDLANAEAHLKDVLERADATEEDIAEAESAVADAETSAANAKKKADDAKAAAIKARNDADAAYIAAEKALGEANAASDYATYAATMAKEYRAAYDAQKTADDASTAAGNAAANLAAANKRLSTARAQLETILNNATATEAEIAAARAEVENAQAAVDAAKVEAEASSKAAALAKALADSAKADAEEAQKAADKAQKAADDAYNKADEAQKAVDALAVTVTTMRTQITQTQEQIALKAEKTEVELVKTKATDAYDQASAALSTAQTASMTAGAANFTAEGTANAVNALASRVTQSEADIVTANDAISLKASKEEVKAIQVGGRNLFPDTYFDGEPKRHERVAGGSTEGGFHFYPIEQIKSGTDYTISANIRGNANINFYQICTVGSNYALPWARRAELSATDYRRFTLTFQVPTDRVFGNAFICTQWGEDSTFVGDWFEIEPKSLKLEKGNKATDWTYAPEDLLDDIVQAQDDAKNAIESITRAESELQVLADQISAIVVDGDGATGLKQDSTGAWFFNLSDIDGKFAAANEKAAELEGIVLDDKERIDALRSDTDALKYLVAYIKQGTDEEGNPLIELGNGDEKGEDGSSKFKVKITNKSIRFEESGYAPAEIDREAIIIEKAKLRGELEIGVDADDGIDGVWVWKRRSNGNLGLTWKGVE